MRKKDPFFAAYPLYWSPEAFYNGEKFYWPEIPANRRDKVKVIVYHDERPDNRPMAILEIEDR
jgi:hypothetical protein